MKNLLKILLLFCALRTTAQSICVIRCDCKRTLAYGTSFFPLRSAVNQLPGDTVVNTNWVQLSGTSILSGGTSQNATVLNPSIGLNLYSVTVKTQSGKQFIALDTVIVNAPLPPTATISGNLSVLGTTDTLTCNAVDPNQGGGIIQYGWGKISGPGSQTTLGANTAICVVTGLQNGTYTYKCTVWNQAGLIGSASITFNVVAQKIISKIVIYYMDGTSVTVPVSQ